MKKAHVFNLIVRMGGLICFVKSLSHLILYLNGACLSHVVHAKDNVEWKEGTFERNFGNFSIHAFIILTSGPWAVGPY